MQAGPEVQPPAEAPAGGVVAADLQRACGGGGQLRRAAERDLGAGEEAVEVRDVAVVEVAGLHVPVFEPLLQLPGLADLVRREPRRGPRRVRRGSSASMPRISAAAMQCGEQVADDLHVHRRAGADASRRGDGRSRAKSTGRSRASRASALRPACRGRTARRPSSPDRAGRGTRLSPVNS